MPPQIGHDSKPSVSPQLLFKMLSHRSRCQLLVELAETNPLDIDEYVSGGGEKRLHDPETVKIGLYHVHLPALDEAGIVDWEYGDNPVRQGPNFEDVRPVLALLGDHEEAVPGCWP